MPHTINASNTNSNLQLYTNQHQQPPILLQPNNKTQQTKKITTVMLGPVLNNKC